MNSAPNQVDLSQPTSIMHYVLHLAEQGNASTQPNPRVGCVLVKGGEIVGEGFHQHAGGLHAERIALQQAGDAARGATAYVNLEPCCHQGRTPPCTDALIDAGVVKVIAAMRDPNPLVAGGGFDLLASAGVEVEAGLLEHQALLLNRGFISRMKTGMPWVIVKSAASLDGRTAAYNGESKWITGEQARQHVHQLRSQCSAVITGIQTVLADDPQMTVRLDTPASETEHGDLGLPTRQPLRVVLDTNLQMPLEARILQQESDLVIFTASNDDEKIASLLELGVEVIQIAVGADERLDLRQVLQELGRWQCNEVLIEAGQTLSGAFVKHGLVDELRLFYAASIIGDQGRAMFEFDEPLAFSSRVNFTIQDVQRVAGDFSVLAFNEQSLAALS